MNKAMIAATSGMSVEESVMTQISENLANADTPGYKASDAWVSALNSGLGATTNGTRLNLTQGKMMKSGGPFDLAISGQGFFKVHAPNGDIAYSRLGDFHRDEKGRMVNGQGCTLVGVSLPANLATVDVHEDGKIVGTVGEQKNVALGQIELYRFPAPDQLRQGAVKGVFFSNHATGEAQAFTPGDGTKLEFGELEKSNISIVESMLSLLSAQRAYEANSKGVQAADEMLRIANNLQRS
jgi:flagellar basal-body rod protein FlgG